MIRVLLVGVALTGLGGGLTSPGVPVSGGRFTGGVGGPYAEFTIIDAGLLLCNGVPCVLPDGGLGGQFVDLVSNQTAGGIKTWGTRQDFPAGLDASVVFTPTVNFTGGSNGIGSISGNGASSINIATRGQNVQINNGGIAVTISDGGNSRISVGTAGSGTTSSVAFSTGEVGAFGSMVGNTHANRLATFNTTQPTIGYCTTDNAWYWGDGTAAHDLTCSTDSCTSQSFCAADGGSCWTGSPTGSCTLNGATPSVCTATVKAGTKCTCSPVGTTAAIALGGCAVSLSSTTLTITGPAAASNDVNFNCQ